VFSFLPHAAANSILIVHNLGIAQARLSRWKDEMKIRLRPWTSAKGRMWINDAPAVRKDIGVGLVKFRESRGSIPMGFRNADGRGWKFQF
jgi:hypothetical protein